MSPPSASAPDPRQGLPSGVLQAVLLDLDDTLVDTRGAFAAAIEELAGHWLPHLDADQRARAALAWALDRHRRFAAYTRGELDFTEQRRLRVGDLHREFGGPELSGAEFARWDAAYLRAFTAACRPLPGAADLVDRLRGAGVPLGVVTNAARELQLAKLVQAGFGDRLPVLVAVDDLGVGKPDPAVFRLACRRLDLAPSRVVYLGDELDVDARGARDAGLVGVWLDRHGSGLTPGDVPVVRSPGEAAGLFEAVGLLPTRGTRGVDLGAEAPAG